jgi:hypothetical protein
MSWHAVKSILYVVAIIAAYNLVKKLNVAGGGILP